MKKVNKVNIDIKDESNITIKDSRGNTIHCDLISLSSVVHAYDSFCYREDLKDLIDQAILDGHVPPEKADDERFMNSLLESYMDVKESDSIEHQQAQFYVALSDCLDEECDEE